jgi:hypothetical protein
MRGDSRGSRSSAGSMGLMELTRLSLELDEIRTGR